MKIIKIYKKRYFNTESFKYRSKTNIIVLLTVTFLCGCSMKRDIAGYMQNGYILDKDQKTLAAYSNGYILDKEGKIAGTYRNGGILTLNY